MAEARLLVQALLLVVEGQRGMCCQAALPTTLFDLSARVLAMLLTRHDVILSEDVCGLRGRLADAGYGGSSVVFAGERGCWPDAAACDQALKRRRVSNQSRDRSGRRDRSRRRESGGGGSLGGSGSNGDAKAGETTGATAATADVDQDDLSGGGRDGDEHKEEASSPPAPFLNSGVFAGTAGAILDMLETIAKECVVRPPPLSCPNSKMHY